MRKSILALATGSTVFAIVAAGATVPGFTGSPALESIVTSTASIENDIATCNALISNVSYELGVDEVTPVGATSSEIETVTVTFSGGASLCNNDTITATLSSGSTNVLYSGTFGTTAVLEAVSTYWAVGSDAPYTSPGNTRIVATNTN